MYTDKEKKYIITREQRDAKGNIKIIKRDFFDDLPRSIESILNEISWRWKNYDWFEEAWNKYREHVIEATTKGTKIKAPGFIFNSYIDKQVEENFLDDEKRSLLHSDSDLDELFHHGIKGQKWGVRRFQNEDGTLTEEGKLRYNPDGSVKDPAKMTDEQLRKANERMTAEQKFQQLTGTTQPGKALTRDNAIRIGATFIGTAALPLLYTAVKGNLRTANKGELLTASLLAGAIGALMATTSSLGGQASRITDAEK